MARKIDTDAEINSIRLAEQAGDVVAVDAGYWHLYAKEGGLYLEDDNEVAGGPLGVAFEPGGRLTLTTAVPVTTSDVNNATTLYYTPYKHNMISLYDGARWIPVPFTEKSLDISGFTASKPYDIFGYLSSGTLALEGLVWTDATTRATALAYQNGRLVKSGATTRLYLGSIYMQADQKCDSSMTMRNVWNYYNRVSRPFYVLETTLHTYNSNTIRHWNNSPLYVEYIIGVVEDSFVDLSLWSRLNPSNASYPARVMITFDAGTSYDAQLPSVINYVITNDISLGASNNSKYSAVGYHTLNVMEQTVGGTANANFQQARLSGAILG